jgi:hypothetical protein
LPLLHKEDSPYLNIVQIMLRGHFKDPELFIDPVYIAD